MIPGIALLIIGSVHLIKPDIFFSTGFLLGPEKFKIVQRIAGAFVSLAGLTFIVMAW